MSYLDAEGWPQRGETGQSVVALGGGHGLSATLRALRHITHDLTAVVTVADDGGSSGRLRQEMDVLPPGDLRMALASLCEESEWGLTWRDVMQLRLRSTGSLNGHALGNLLIAGLWQLLDDPVDGLDWVVLGPGSWYTSVIPHLLVSDLHRALVTTDAHRALILNLGRQRGETDSMTTADHVRVLAEHAPDLKLDVVVADPTATDDIDDLVEAGQDIGARVLLRQVRTGDGQPHHDPLRLAAALRDAFDGFLGEVGRTEPWLA